MYYLVFIFISVLNWSKPIEGSFKHDIHISKCEINYNEDSSYFEIATQIYIDDFQKVLTKIGGSDLRLCTDKEAKNADAFISQYLDQRLSITLDGKLLKQKLIGKEPSDDALAVWCYIEAKAPKSFSQLKVKYSALMDLYDDQKNIVNLKVHGKIGYFLLNTKSFEQTVNYK